MYPHSLQLSLETLIAASPLLGHPLEDRASIHRLQDLELVKRWQDASSIPLGNSRQQELFCVAPLDLLVAERDGEKQFHLLELNGTGIGGLTNMPPRTVSAILAGMNHMAVRQHDSHSHPLVLIASSGKESIRNPRLNKLIYEKLLYADAFMQGFRSLGTDPTISTLDGLRSDDSPLRRGGPAVVVGYIKEFLDTLRLGGDGQLTLMGRAVTGGVNDRFCMNVISHFEGNVDLNRFATMNRCHLAGSDKGTAYGLLNDFLQAYPQSHFPESVPFEMVQNREDLCSSILEWQSRGMRPVIKPRGTGLGHGIEFFLGQDSDGQVLRKVDRSLRMTEEFYGVEGGAFPYTVCEYVDACTVPQKKHPLYGHKYELRVVVYRDGMTLRAFPSIIKVAADPPAPGQDSERGLINNITATCVNKNARGTDFMFPLANRKTMDAFGLEEGHMVALCSAATGYVRYILDEIQRNPQRLGLPGTQSQDGQRPFELQRLCA